MGRPSPSGKVSAVRLTDGVCPPLGGQPPTAAGGTAHKNYLLPLPLGEVSCVSKTERAAPSGEEVSSDTNVYLPTIPNKTL